MESTLFCHPLAQPWAIAMFDGGPMELALGPQDGDRPRLWAAPDHLELRVGDARHGGAWVDTSELRRRAAEGSILTRACGRLNDARVLDPMAGWGVDALLLAAAGARVVAVEQEPMLHALARDLARRVGDESVEFRLGDGRLALQSADSFDVVYLDPMFPAHGKSALPSKRMQFTRSLPGSVVDMAPVDVLRWIQVAQPHARRRVVLKRRLKDPVVGAPNGQIKGRSVRYDVYRGGAA
ncbi:MAG: class I SAM-dependent methyltransferase [Pseudomonadales bacterium]